MCPTWEAEFAVEILESNSQFLDRLPPGNNLRARFVGLRRADPLTGISSRRRNPEFAWPKQSGNFPARYWRGEDDRGYHSCLEACRGGEPARRRWCPGDDDYRSPPVRPSRPETRGPSRNHPRSGRSGHGASRDDRRRRNGPLHRHDHPAVLPQQVRRPRRDCRLDGQSGHPDPTATQTAAVSSQQAAA